MFGEQRPFIIQYYLVDDTVEVREVHDPNDGRDPFPLFLKRQRVPKDRDNVDCKFRFPYEGIEAQYWVRWRSSNLIVLRDRREMIIRLGKVYDFYKRK